MKLFKKVQVSVGKMEDLGQKFWSIFLSCRPLFLLQSTVLEWFNLLRCDWRSPNYRYDGNQSGSPHICFLFSYGQPFGKTCIWRSKRIIANRNPDAKWNWKEPITWILKVIVDRYTTSENLIDMRFDLTWFFRIF